MKQLAKIWVGFALITFMITFMGCMEKEPGGGKLGSGGMTPPWDSAHFVPKHLEGYSSPASDSLFTVFKVIASIDSESGDQKKWERNKRAIDTVRGNQIFDTGFVFPPNPEAAMAFGYDDVYRGDTLFRYSYGNGLYTQDHPCAKTTILSGQFEHPARWLNAGLKAEDIMNALGKPLYTQKNVLRYLSHRVEKSKTDTTQLEIYEGVNFYFQRDSLIAAVIQHSQPCH